MGHDVDVNPAILVWARKRAGFGLQEAADKFSIRHARLEKIENSAERTLISRTLFRKITKLYRQPPLVFYLSSPPREEAYEVEFRRTNQSISRKELLVLESIIRNVRARQSLVRATIELETNAAVIPFIQSLSIGAGVKRAVDSLVRLIGGSQVMTNYHSLTSSRLAFNIIRKKAEDVGIFVILKGNLGSSHTDIPVSTFRGLTISDPIAPFVVINPGDSYPARTFTLFHEMVYLLLGESRIIKEDYGDDQVEEFCNKVACHCLLPETILNTLELHGSAGRETLSRLIGNFARKMNLSSTMVVYRLFHSQRIDQVTFMALRESYHAMWVSARESSQADKKSQDRVITWFMAVALENHYLISPSKCCRRRQYLLPLQPRSWKSIRSALQSFFGSDGSIGEIGALYSGLQCFDRCQSGLLSL
ncbi:MAG: ImmA/IrrE family metallo-endopeptidase [Bryobacterales bacterium]|nr:ImmA/IrrE family metallo-endopeptidase [Bryobacterales bacterium]